MIIRSNELVCAIMQPTFLPWLGYFDLIDQSDVFILLDDVQFSKQSWQQRNQLRTSKGLEYFTMPVKHGQELISDVRISDEIFVKKLLKFLKINYIRAPFFHNYFSDLMAVLNKASENKYLAEINISFICWVCRVIGINTQIIRSSSLKCSGVRSRYLIEICKEVGASTYLSPLGSKGYLQKDAFLFGLNKIKVLFHNYNHPSYKQIYHPFISHASVIDLIFNEGPNSLETIRSGRGSPIVMQQLAKSYIFRVDCSPEIGIGHVMRCLALANRFLVNYGVSCHFLSRSLPDTYIKLIEESGHSVYLLPAPVGVAYFEDGPAHSSWLGANWKEDAEQTILCIKSILTAMPTLVIDHYAIDIRWEKMLRPIVDEIIVIDDLADRPHECDFLIDQDYYPRPATRYDGLVPSSCELLLGPSYALLRDEFYEKFKVNRETKSSVNRILIFYGGSDKENITAMTIDALLQRQNLKLHVDILVGAINSNIESLRIKCERLPNYTLHVQVDNVAELMDSADLAFGACGTTSLERMYLGLPAIVVVFANNQLQPTLTLERLGTVINLGDASTVTTSKLLKAFDLVSRDLDLLKKMSLECIKLFGNDRNNLEKTLLIGKSNKYDDLIIRNATISDREKIFKWRSADFVQKFSSKIDTVSVHNQWFDSILLNPKVFMFIASKNYISVGVIRLDIDYSEIDQEYYGLISIYLTEEGRYQGNGTKLIQFIENFIISKLPNLNMIAAIIHEENINSINLFKKLGFIRVNKQKFIKRIY